MRILLCYPGHEMSTYDVATGYEAAFKALGHEVKAFDYHVRLSFWSKMLAAHDQLYVTDKRGSAPMNSPDNLSLLASEGLPLEVIEFVPDIVFVINGLNLHRRAYELIWRLDVPVVIYMTESPYIEGNQLVVAKGSRAAALFTNDKNSVYVYRDALGLPVEYLPHSYKPTIHRPRPGMNESHEFGSDVLFQGTLWQERQELFYPLASLIDDYDIDIGGIFINPEGTYEGHEMPNNELAQRYAGTKIAINHHRTTISPNGKGTNHIANNIAYSIGPRAYEIAACGTFQLCDDTRPELYDVFGDSVATYSDGDELLDKVKYYLENEAERHEMAAAAHQKVKPCTFENRAKDIVIPILEKEIN